MPNFASCPQRMGGAEVVAAGKILPPDDAATGPNAPSIFYYVFNFESPGDAELPG